jgi:hypothetical protein
MSAPVKAMVAAVLGAVFGAVVVVVVVGATVAGAVATGVTGSDDVDEQADEVLHGPVVIVAVFATAPVALDATTAAYVTVAVSPAARLTAKFHVVPELVTMQVSGAVTAQTGVPWTVSEDGTSSLTVAVPAPSPTFLIAIE